MVRIRWRELRFMDFYMYHMPIPLVCAMYLYEPFHRLIDSNLAYAVSAWLVTLALTAVAVKTDGMIRQVRDRLLSRTKQA